MDELHAVIAPSPDADWTELSNDVRLARQKQGRVFEKHILSFGELIHPVSGAKIKIDKAFADTLVKNFNDQVCDIVQVPLANDKNEHVENPGANLGEVLGIRVDDTKGKIYAQVDARKQADDFGKTLLGASAFMHLNYTNTKNKQKVGPTLLHVAVTNRPYVTGLDPYEEIVAASAEYESEPALLQMSATSEVEEAAVPRTLEEILAELKADHDLDVDALKTQLSTTETEKTELETRLSTVETDLASRPDTDELVDRIKASLQGTEAETKLSGAEIDDDTVVMAVSELAQQNVRLTEAGGKAVERIEALERRNTEGEIDRLVSEGRILPGKRETYLNLALSNRDLFDELVPDEAIVSLNNEQGTAPTGEEAGKREWDVEAELSRVLEGPAAKYIVS